MSYKSKYVVIERSGVILPIVFSDLMKHTDVANPYHTTILGAGFCHINDEGQYTCYGESVSLRTKSRDSVDSEVLNKYLGVIQD